MLSIVCVLYPTRNGIIFESISQKEMYLSEFTLSIMMHYKQNDILENEDFVFLSRQNQHSLSMEISFYLSFMIIMNQTRLPKDKIYIY
jgi:hypothetical protein